MPVFILRRYDLELRHYVIVARSRNIYYLLRKSLFIPHGTKMDIVFKR